MPGKVFISCGQRPPDERTHAEAVRRLLTEEFHLNPYLAFKVQSLSDILTITNELRTSDYYLFIDFVRRQSSPNDLPMSLFTHQELAVAHQLGFRDEMIALQERGALLEGYLRYVLGNPEQFGNQDELLEAVRRLVREKGWGPAFSRNLVVAGHEDVSCVYTDHTGTATQRVWQIRIENRRNDRAALRTVCILDSLRDCEEREIVCADRAYLKWAGQAGYERTILPQDFGLIDAFAIRADRPGLFLHSLRDTPREPIVTDEGDYVLRFKLFADAFPIVLFEVHFSLRWRPATTDWRTASELTSLMVT
ncbi:MAG: hypothetical protein JW958_13525 [Candidatus Eisenbacteria bacterium]|nr:hypothetical protein [Candidatus Eisenbacteria bacterium]